MFLNMIEQFLIVAFAGLMVWAAVCDARNYTIPNRISASAAALWLAYAVVQLLAGAPVTMVLLAMGLGAAAFAIGTGLFALRLVGGGDVKLFAAAALWAGPALALPLVLVSLVAGGLLAVGILAVRVTRDLTLQTAHGRDTAAFTVVFMSALKSTIPFGVAISLGGVFVAYRLLFGAPVL